MSFDLERLERRRAGLRVLYPRRSFEPRRQSHLQAPQPVPKPPPAPAGPNPAAARKREPTGMEPERDAIDFVSYIAQLGLNQD